MGLYLLILVGFIIALVEYQSYESIWLKIDTNTNILKYLKHHQNDPENLEF